MLEPVSRDKLVRKADVLYICNGTVSPEMKLRMLQVLCLMPPDEMRTVSLLDIISQISNADQALVAMEREVSAAAQVSQPSELGHQVVSS